MATLVTVEEPSGRWRAAAADLSSAAID